MARFKDYFFGKLISAVERYDKQPYRDWRTDFVGKEGLIILYESEHKAPGKVFFHILVGVGRWMHCTVGDWEPGGEKDTIITRNSIYTFFPPAQSEQRRKTNPVGAGCSFREDSR